MFKEQKDKWDHFLRKTTSSRKVANQLESCTSSSPKEVDQKDQRSA